MNEKSDTCEGVNDMAVMAIKKPSAYIVTVGNKKEFLERKADSNAVKRVEVASKTLRSQCMSSKVQK